VSFVKTLLIKNALKPRKKALKPPFLQGKRGFFGHLSVKNRQKHNFLLSAKADRNGKK